MERYETPRMEFEELNFFEKIACSNNNCWKRDMLFFDNPKTCYKEKYTICIKDDKGCTDSKMLKFENKLLCLFRNSQYKNYIECYVRNGKFKANTQARGVF